ncbi:unnamed protein product [Gongylonema pulchrum]|uniref:F-box domain-containing protein n=1 Tax=Gongylonema pulchrum TaxID=637853 RepID=A0A183DNR2_9BILA|nr:unnamed protein product [Gongylonema pulchrum]
MKCNLRCEPSVCYRARLVCNRWRTAIDEMDEESRKAILSEGHARLFICDRRRFVIIYFPRDNEDVAYVAILEKFCSLPSCSYTVAELTTPRKSVFLADCFAHTAFNSWAYRFDVSQWIRNFDIVEVLLDAVFGRHLMCTLRLTLKQVKPRLGRTERARATMRFCTRLEVLRSLIA